MAQFEQHFVQDLTQQIKVRHCGSIVFNADNESNVVSVRLFNGSEPVAISGSVVGAVVCSDGSTVPLTGSYSGNTASITLTGDCFAVLGQIGVGIQIVNGTQKTTVLKVIYNVETLTTENVVDPGSRITLEVGDLIAAIDEAVATIPEDYSALSAHFPATGKFVVGTNTSATEENAVAEGEDTIASGLSSHAEGYASEASGDYSHSEGGSIASGGYSHAEGSASEASGDNAHAEGYETTASSDNSHSEGWGTTSSGMNAHAEGVDTVASGNQSHAEGEGTIANHAAQSVSGTYNVADPSQAAPTAKGTYAEIVGNGIDDDTRSNARTLDWSGNEELAGDLTINKNGQNEMTVGEELGDLKSAFDKLPFIELYNKSARSTGYIAQDGSTTTTATWNITDYMPITSDAVYYYSGIRTPGTAPYSAFYNVSKTLISTFKQQTGTNVLENIPVGTAYVRFSVLDSDIDTFNFVKKGFPTNGDFETVNYALGTLSSEVGDLEDLDTEDKTSVVRAINEVNSHFIGSVDSAVNDWLDNHPEATTTVQDASLTETKFAESLKRKTINDYITPEMFGAVGDGVADDASELQSAISYAISNNVALKLTDGKTYGISTGLSINGWIDIPKSTATIKALSALTPQMIYIQSPSIITNRNEIGKRYTISLNIDCNGSAIGIHGQQFFEYIIHDTYIKNAAIGIQVDSPAAEVSFVDCYIDGSDIAWSVGVANNASDVQYNHVRMYNCHTAFNVSAYCEIVNCHPWMDNNINGSIGIKSSSVCRVTNSFVDTYQKAFYKTNGSNLIVDDCYINVSSEFYSSDYGNAIVFYGENNTDYSYSLLSNLFIVSGNGITTKLSNISGFSTPLINSRLESVDASMMLSRTGLVVNAAPVLSAGTGIKLNAQSSCENVYARYAEFSITAESAINAWATVLTLNTGYRPMYTATFWGAKAADSTSIPFFVQADGKILAGKNIAAGDSYRIAGVMLK